jgi:hypothetical protein
VVRTLREDTRNPEVLYLGTEFGLFYSLDGGGGWLRVAMGLPSVAVNDLVVHPRDNDLILGTHGRGIWILDQINALQELGPELHEAPSHLFTMEPARQIRYRREFPHMGDQVFRGQNPPAGAIVDYWLGPDVGTPRLSVLDVAGTEVAWMEGTEDVGLNRGVWNLRHSLPGQGEEEDEDEEEGGFGGQRGPPRSGPSGPLVVPGAYTVRLSVGGAAHEQRLVIEEDPRLDVTPDVRARWTADLLDIAALGLRVEEGLEAAEAVVEELDAGERSVSDEDEAQARDLHREWRELRSRIRRLYNEVESWVGPLTTDQASEWAYYLEMAGTLEAASE